MVKKSFKQKIVVIGGGGHAKVLIAVIKKLKTFSITGYTDKKDQGKLLGAKYLGTDDILKKLFKQGTRNVAIGIGQIKSAELRKSIYKNLKKIGFTLPVIISPTAIINEEIVIEEGTVIMDGVIINSGTKIGKCCIVNTNASIDHDCKMADFTHIAPGVTISGGVKVGKHVLIGTGANVIHNVSITHNCIIGAGSLVSKSINKKGVYSGNPASLKRSIK